MKILIPERRVGDIAKFTRLNPSLLYQERRKAGTAINDTGTRNTIDRLDLFCEWNLDRNPEVVRIVGERYLTMYQNHISPPDKEVTINDLLAQLGEVSRECGEAVAALAGRQDIGKCTVEVSQAKEALEKALALVIALQRQC
ncbi:MAG: hypothetical protein JSS81_05955 [Acidobacteria bacterium]|nr:hypothetical protein [Acidobacteriota bacterium]